MAECRGHTRPRTGGAAPPRGFENRRVLAFFRMIGYLLKP